MSAATVAKRLKYRIFGTSQSAGVEPVIIIQPKVFQNVDKVEICDKTYVTHTNLKRFITPDGLLTVTLHVEFQSTGNSIVFQQRQQKSMLQFIDQGSNLLNDATFSDFTFIVKSKTFKVHKNILANESETMRAMFTNELKESVEGQCVVDDIEPDVFHNMLEFIYAGMISANLEDVAIDLYKAAHYYRIVKLMDICKECIHSRLTNDNSMDVYELATMYEMEDVRMDAWKIVKRLEALSDYEPFLFYVCFHFFSQCFKIYFPLNNESLSLKEFREIRDLITKQADFWSNHKKTD